MSVVPFPRNRIAPVSVVASAPRRSTGLSVVPTTHSIRGGSVISWLRPEVCSCCGRPTLHGRDHSDGEVLCGKCSPPHAA